MDPGLAVVVARPVKAGLVARLPALACLEVGAKPEAGLLWLHSLEEERRHGEVQLLALRRGSKAARLRRMEEQVAARLPGTVLARVALPLGLEATMAVGQPMVAMATVPHMAVARLMVAARHMAVALPTVVMNR